MAGLPLLLLLESSFECYCLYLRYSFLYHWDWAVHYWTLQLGPKGTRTFIIKNGPHSGGEWRVQPLLLLWSPLLDTSAWTLGTRTCIISKVSKVVVCGSLASAATPGVLFWMPLLGSEVLNSLSLRLGSRVVVYGGTSLYCYSWSLGTEVLNSVSLRMVRKVVVCGGSVSTATPEVFFWTPPLGSQLLIKTGQQGGGGVYWLLNDL